MTKFKIYPVVFLVLAGLSSCSNREKINDQKTDNPISQNNLSDSGKKTQPESTAQTAPKDVLYTIPTFEKYLPEFENSKGDSSFSIIEDDWRQIEFISKSQKPAIDQEIAKIKDVIDHFSKTMNNHAGFTKIEERNLIPRPVSFPASRLSEWFPGVKLKQAGISIEQHPGHVKGGICFTSSGIHYYAVIENNTVKTFGFFSADSEAGFKSSLPLISRILESQQLYLIDWRKKTVYDEHSIEILAK